MGRPTHSRSLSLWSNGIRVGHWRIPTRGEPELQYDSDWVRADYGRPVSLSLPFNLENLAIRGPRVNHYFDNLLPDSEAIRRRIADRFRTGSVAPFELLRAIGRDCVGAVQLLGEEETPVAFDRVEGVKLTDEMLEQHLIEAVSPRAFGALKDPDDDFRISLAGAQEKAAFLKWKGQWYAPRGSTPTTHIFKLPLGIVGGRRADFSTSVDNEWLCLKVLKAYGLAVAEAGIQTFGTQRVLVVGRFDRQESPDGTWLQRLPQEDFCQIFGYPPTLKYENQGGPGWKQLFDIVKRSVFAQQDMHTLISTQILFWMLRAPDGHAKNFSIKLLQRGAFHLTPLYDVISAFPVLGEMANQWSARELKLAMALTGKRRHYLAHNIQRRHFNSTALHVGYGASAERLMDSIVERTPAVIQQVSNELPKGFSMHVADAILEGLKASAHALEAMKS